VEQLIVNFGSDEEADVAVEIRDLDT